jgi:hypothetical protein
MSLQNNITIHSCDPVSGKFIVCVIDSKEWWEWDIQKDSWSKITDMTPKIPWPSGCMFHVPIPEYGVILIFIHSGSAKYAYLYRHTVPSSVGQTFITPSKAGPVLDISPSPVHTSARISITNINDTRGLHLGVYDLGGRLIQDLTKVRARLGNGITWNASCLPAGLYLLKARTGKGTFTRRMLIMR